jgi:hypothetical protein
MTNIDEEIRSMIEAFATDMSVLVRRKALEAVSSALGGGGKVAAHAGHAGHAGPARAAEPVKRARAVPAPRAKAAAAPAKAGKAAAPPKAAGRRPAASKRPPGAKRPPAELAKLVERLQAHIQAHPGSRMEAIAKALSTPTRDLNLPVKKLLHAKKIRVEGHKRATEYYAA